MAQIYEALEDLRKKAIPRHVIPQGLREDIQALRRVLTENIGYLTGPELDLLATEWNSEEQRKWVGRLREMWESKQSEKDPWASDGQVTPTSRRSEGPRLGNTVSSLM
jgi:hypothetical protein